MTINRRFRHNQSLHERLSDEAQRLRSQATELPPGLAKDVALRKGQQAETAAHIDEWLESPGFRPPQ